MALATFCATLAMGQALPAEESPDTAGNPATAEVAPEEQQLTAEEALAAAAEKYGPPPPEPEVAFECENPKGDEIVVCAALEDQEQFRVPSSLDEGDDSHLSFDGRTPDLFGIPNHGPVVARGCFIPPCPPPPVYYFDIEALPEAPPGSDADKIAKGEMPEP